MNYDTMSYTLNEGIAEIKFNRPETLNAMNEQFLLDLTNALNKAKFDDNVQVVILTGEGKSFVAGGDIKAMNQMSTIEFHDFCTRIQDITRKFRQLGKVVIAAINGWALGGGCEIACACDIRIASDNAIIGLPEPRIGLTNTSGICHLLPKIVGFGKAMELVCTGNKIDAKEAHRIGLVNDVVPLEELMDRSKKMATDVMKCSPVAVKIGKEAINVCADIDLESALYYEVEAITTAFSSEDRKEGLTSFIEKRKPEFKGK